MGGRDEERMLLGISSRASGGFSRKVLTGSNLWLKKNLALCRRKTTGGRVEAESPVRRLSL